MFSDFILNPTSIRFDGQDEDETIVLLLRAHIITNLVWLIPALFFLILPFIINPISRAIGLDLSNLPETYSFAFLIINYLIVLVISFEGFLSWYFNVYILTNKSIVDVDFHSLLSRNIDIAGLKSVEQANSLVAGIFGTLFNFGDVNIQTAGATVAIDFHNVPNPSRVADIVNDLSEQLKGGE